ncbi:MAG: helix-turn-helix domain-containing protein, partial [Acidobacteria bacterium]|nr:helix-turn-helix domain-containing protein [Acidobacteriota bacterium]
MKCDLCNDELILKRADCYHYAESGLPNVYLSGIEVEECPNGHGESPRIPRILELHELIADAVCLKPSPLTGAEARFLRKELGMKAKDWAAYLHIDAATLSRWENGEQAIVPMSDVF